MQFPHKNEMPFSLVAQVVFYQRVSLTKLLKKIIATPLGFY
jgi:hypothetical protein